jgi:putative tryptophan/tyrosine transport system substrate-binding protein
MDRRRFLVTSGAGVLAAPLGSEAQQGGKVFRIGLLWPYSRSISAVLADAFRRGLRGLGYVEGANILLEERWAEAMFDRLPSAQRATKTVPIVMTLVTDPVESGVVASLARPGGNVTGLSLMHPDLSGKRLALLKEIVPTLSRVAVLWSSSTPSYRVVLRETEAAARALGMHLHVLEVRSPADLDNTFSAIARERDRAVIVLPDAMFRNEQKRMLDLASKNQLPTMYWSRELVEAGGLMAYGANIPDTYRQAATMVDRILRGAQPAELPIEQPAKLELVINRKVANALGLTIPPSLLLRADHVIE